MSELMTNTKIDCQEIKELLPAYSIDALNEEERQLVKRGLQECPEIQDELVEFMTLAETLLYSSPPETPAPSLKASILSQATSSTSTAPVSKEKIVRVPPASNRRLLWVASILLVLLVVSNLFWFTNSRNTNLADQPPDLIAYLASGALSRAELSQPNNDAEDAPTGTLAWVTTDDDSAWVAWLVARDLPDDSPSQTYEIRLLRDYEEPLIIGEFNGDDGGVATYIFEITEPLENFAGVEVRQQTSNYDEQPQILLFGEL